MAVRDNRNLINEIEMDSMPSYRNVYPQTIPANNMNQLPPEWECKYDPNFKRFYYINHQTKTTTWVDPRLNPPELSPIPVAIASGSQLRQTQASAQNRQSSPTIHPNSSASPHSPSCSSKSPQASPHLSARNSSRSPQLSSRSDDKSEHIPMTVLSTTEGGESTDWRDELMSKYGITVSSGHDDDDETTTVMSTDEQLVLKLKSEFIDVSEDRIIELIEKYGNNESVLVNHLRKESIKYKDNCRMESHRTSVVKSHPSSRRQSQVSHLSIKNESTKQSPSSQNGRKHSESQEVTLEVLKEEFPDVELSVLSDILTSCSGDVIKAAYKLNSMGFVKSTQSSSRRESWVPKSITTSSSNATPEHALPPGAEQVKKKILEEFKHLDLAVIQLVLESGEYNEAKVRQFIQTINEPANSHPEPSLSTPRSSITVPLSQPTSPSPYQLVELDTEIKMLESEVRNEIYSVENRIVSTSLSKGPDRDLPKGANKTLLSERSYFSLGPNSEFYNGPNPDYVHGPSKRIPKPVLNCGPQACLLSRNNIQVTVTDGGITSTVDDSRWLFKLGSKACCWQR